MYNQLSQVNPSYSKKKNIQANMLCIVAENYIMSNMAMIINTTYQQPNHGSGVMAVHS